MTTLTQRLSSNTRQMKRNLNGVEHLIIIHHRPDGQWWWSVTAACFTTSDVVATEGEAEDAVNHYFETLEKGGQK